MFNKDFYPTPESVIDLMLEGENVKDKICYEPEAGKGDIVDRLILEGAKTVLASENNKDLLKILHGKCVLIGEDFLKIESHQISHIDYIFMNPPFSADERHINHAYDIAPDGCKIIALCNYITIDNPFSEGRKKLAKIINDHGRVDQLTDYFKDAERKTGVEVALVKILKPGASYQNEFDGFVLDEDPEEQGNGIMQYNVIRDLVNRYIASVKLYDKQLELALQMNNLTSGFFSCEIGMSVTHEDKPMQRNEFKKAMQKSAWNFIFEKLNMQKYTTKGLKAEINNFVEKQEHVPFTMTNIYKMLQIIIGTHSGRMDKALLEVFNKLTEHYHDNRFSVEGWKTNSHYLINEKFILPSIVGVGWSGQFEISHFGHNRETVEDMQKALCYITGENYDNYSNMYQYFNNKEVPGTEGSYPRQYVKYEFNTWYDWGFFEVKGFKKGSMHFKFKDQSVWAKFNQHISRIKGYPLYEAVKKEEKQPKTTKKANVLFEINI